MFSEELAGNASRKRAEENRARRRRLKQEQERKANKNAAATAATAAATAATAVTVGAAADRTRRKQVDASGLPAAASAANGGARDGTATAAPSAVERAERERQLRAETARRTKACVAVQSFARRCASNRRLRRNQEQLLEQRLQDLDTLRTILRQTKGADVADAYVPPPATTTALTRQLLFSVRSSSNLAYPDVDDGSGKNSEDDKATAGGRKRTRRTAMLLRATNRQYLFRLLECCVLPGLRSQSAHDPNVNALLVWLESSHGKYRLEGLIRLSVLAATSIENDSVSKFLRCIVGLTMADAGSSSGTAATGLGHPDLIRYGRSLLLPKSAASFFPAPTSVTGKKRSTSFDKVPPFALEGAPLDLFAVARYHLMFTVASSPIPKNADDVREQCITESNRNRSGALVNLVLKAAEAAPANERDVLRVRVVTELWTVPLFTWKVSSSTISYLVTPLSSPSNGKGNQARTPAVSFVRSLVDLHSDTLASGNVNALFTADDVTLTHCPATASQCLFATLVQICHACSALNGSSNSVSRDPAAIAMYFDLLSTLLDVLPVGTFSSRDSSVEWLTGGKGHHIPIVLSHAILDQCRLILLDSFIRRLFNCALPDVAQFDKVLMTKNDKDLKHEKDLVETGASSAATLAAKEARIDRNKNFWNSSKWASKLTRGVTCMLAGGVGGSGSTSKASTAPGQGILMNTSTMSRKLAGSMQESSATPESAQTEKGENFTLKPPATQHEFIRELFLAICRTYSIILARWGGGGHDDIVRRAPSKSKNEKQRGVVATAKPEACTMSLLNTLCFSTSIVKASWGVIQSDSAIISEVYSIIDADKGSRSVRTIALRPTYSNAAARKSGGISSGAVLLYTFSCTLGALHFQSNIHRTPPVVSPKLLIISFDRLPLKIQPIRS